MTPDERQFLMTAAWMFMRHGQRPRARIVCEALVEDDPRSGAAAAALAELLIDDGETERALELLRSADFPPDLLHAQAVLETRVLRMSGRTTEARSRWSRYIESRKGAERKWI